MSGETRGWWNRGGVTRIPKADESVVSHGCFTEQFRTEAMSLNHHRSRRDCRAVETLVDEFP